MEEEKIVSLIKENYDFDVNSIEKVKGSYKINSKEGIYCLKIIEYEFKHFNFILSAMIYLQERGFDAIPKILTNKNNRKYIRVGKKYGYITPWILSRVSNYDNVLELEKVTQKLAELHKYSEGFVTDHHMKPRIGWFNWINVFETRKSEIIDFKNRIDNKSKKTEFDRLYLEYIDEELERAEKSIYSLKTSNYLEIMCRQYKNKGFCHHDYANHNVLIDKNYNISIVDFDYCILDSYLHDLSSLLLRVMKHGKWDISKANLIINNYSKINEVNEEEIYIMRYFMRFPQDFWQLGIQRYWENKAWDEEVFLNKLTRYIEDRDEKEEFLDSFI